MLIIGLDGATWQIIKPNLSVLPNFKKLIDQYDSYSINLEQKPWSASVWCSMFTGLTPEEHKHTDFVKDGNILNREDIHFDFVWDILERNNIKTLAINIPFVVPPYSFRVKFQGPGHGVPVSDEECDQEIDLLTKKIIEVKTNEKPDLLIAVFTALDKMSHMHWGEKILLDYYKKIDETIGEINKFDDKILYISDHGFTDYNKAPIQTLPKITSTGDELKGDHHPEAIAIAKNMPFKVSQPMDVFKGIVKHFNINN